MSNETIIAIIGAISTILSAVISSFITAKAKEKKYKFIFSAKNTARKNAIILQSANAFRNYSKLYYCYPPAVVQNYISLCFLISTDKTRPFVKSVETACDNLSIGSITANEFLEIVEICINELNSENL